MGEYHAGAAYVLYAEGRGLIAGLLHLAVVFAPSMVCAVRTAVSGTLVQLEADRCKRLNLEL